MNRTEALRQLDSKKQRDRLTAARVLSYAATASDVGAIKSALRVETVPWIRSALEIGLARATATGVGRIESQPAPLASEDDLASEIYSRAVEELTDRFVHEFRPLVGLARVHARREISDFDGSQTSTYLRRMQVLLRGIDTLGKAAAAPRVVATELGSLVREAVDSSFNEVCAMGLVARIPQVDGDDSVVVDTDPELVTLALRNGIKNALEASTSATEPVVVTWGRSSIEFWVTVLDFGVGLPPDGRSLYSIGATTKPEHFGIGLAIVERVTAALDGSSSLEPFSDGWTRFELRFPRNDRP